MAYSRNKPYKDYRDCPWAVRVQAIREEHAWTLQELADEMGVHITTVQRWVEGSKPPSQIAQRYLIKLEEEINREKAPSSA